jgi:hypothetical protein
MKFYETTYDEYINSYKTYNIHPELEDTIQNIPKDFSKLSNIILYGQSGVGKYTQALNIIKKFSPSGLKYEKHIKLENDKQHYCYKISDVHYEIDMSLLGVNSKILWHDLFNQITDIIQVKQEKHGIIMCSNFHMIHTELLDIFYSYMQQYNNKYSNILVKFILLTEHASFIPNSIINNSLLLHIKRPDKEHYVYIAVQNQSNQIVSRLHKNETAKQTSKKKQSKDETQNITAEEKQVGIDDEKHTTIIQKHSILRRNLIKKDVFDTVIRNMDHTIINNCKDVRSFSLLVHQSDIPVNVFTTICNSIIKQMENPDELIFTEFRDVIYDILIYNLDPTECLWYVLSHFIKKGLLTNKNIKNILRKTFIFLKQYNNNYRPIYHLESIFFYIINKIHGYK